ncbi:hypothetical protein [Egicoccus sp. AB-alg2]|uniref:hypothetical protein n=1 Tax=Egicoccus sp. AB-alg2 TaxID=3242693 RepID=UPI00359D04D6
MEQSTPVPKRSWVTLLAGTAFMGVWYALGLMRREPNQGLVDHLGGSDWASLQAETTAATELVATLVGGVGMLGLALVALAVTLIVGPYRRGERWSWQALWAVPVVHVALFVNDLTGFPTADTEVGTYGVLFLVTAVVCTIGLLLGVGAVLRRRQDTFEPA